LKKAVAGNSSLSISTLDRLSTETRGDVNSAVARNPSTSAKTLYVLAKSEFSHVRQLVVMHANACADALTLLSNDEVSVIRKECAKNINTPLNVLKHLASDKSVLVSQSVLCNKSLGEIVKLKKYEIVLRDSGFGAFDFYQVASPKKITSLFINSKHQNEVEFIFGSKDCSTINAISALQSAFTNQRGKINRDDYLKFLGAVNAQVPPNKRAGLAVDNITLKMVLKHFSSQLVIDILMQYSPDESADCLRMLSTLVMFDNEDVNDENIADVNLWISKVKSKFCFHGYLTNKSNKNMLEIKSVFYQARFIESTKEASKLLDAGWHVELPVDADELMEIGKTQRHCVGTKFYAERCVDGSNIIFHISPRENTRKGYTFQYCRSGRLLQAKGFANSSVPNHMKQKSKMVFNELIKN
jgi:hypothetical protein